MYKYFRAIKDFLTLNNSKRTIKDKKYHIFGIIDEGQVVLLCNWNESYLAETIPPNKSVSIPEIIYQIFQLLGSKWPAQRKNTGQSCASLITIYKILKWDYTSTSYIHALAKPPAVTGRSIINVDYIHNWTSLPLRSCRAIKSFRLGNDGFKSRSRPRATLFLYRHEDIIIFWITHCLTWCYCLIVFRTHTSMVRSVIALTQRKCSFSTFREDLLFECSINMY